MAQPTAVRLDEIRQRLQQVNLNKANNINREWLVWNLLELTECLIEMEQRLSDPQDANETAKIGA